MSWLTVQKVRSSEKNITRPEYHMTHHTQQLFSQKSCQRYFCSHMDHRAANVSIQKCTSEDLGTALSV